MPLQYKTKEQFLAITQNELRNYFPLLDPINDSLTGTILKSNALMSYSLQNVIQDAEKQFYVLTSTNEYLEKDGFTENLTRNEPTAAKGILSQTGILGAAISIDFEYTNDGRAYVVINGGIVSEKTGVITSIIAVGTTAIATTNEAHNFGNGQTVTISDALESGYNGTFQVVVTGLNTFQYEIAGALSAVDSANYSSEYAVVTVECSETGIDTNLESGTAMSLKDAPAVITDQAIVTFDGLSGGADWESDTAFRSRILKSRAAIQGVFTPSDIERAALKRTGNTRVWVVKPTISGVGGAADPKPGQVAVYIVRDDDSVITPAQAILDETKEIILREGKQPADRADSDVFVVTPEIIPVDFTFTAMSSATDEMKIAVTNNLIAFFNEAAQLASVIYESAYKSAIQQSQIATGEFLQVYVV